MNYQGESFITNTRTVINKLNKDFTKKELFGVYVLFSTMIYLMLNLDAITKASAPMCGAHVPSICQYWRPTDAHHSITGLPAAAPGPPVLRLPPAAPSAGLKFGVYIPEVSQTQAKSEAPPSVIPSASSTTTYKTQIPGRPAYLPRSHKSTDSWADKHPGWMAYTHARPTR